MTETFITHVHVDRVRTVENFVIPLSNSKRKHLIITGKNGSGKTSLLESIDSCLSPLLLSTPLKSEMDYDGVNIAFNKLPPHRNSSQKDYTPFLVKFFSSKRKAVFLQPEGIQKIEFEHCLDPGRYFLQYIVNLKADRSFARDDGDEISAMRIDDWFIRLECRLKGLFENDKLELVFDRKNYNFLLQLPNQPPFSFSELSDGYSAVMEVITEILVAMEAVGNHTYDMEGIVIIDEVETHLHVELQKEILPFLCDFFPRIQFIVSTHSPFVLSSIENAVICDLQNRIVTEDLSGYSYDALIESYFKSDKYSDILKRKVARYEALADMPERRDRDMDEYFELKHELSNLPKYLAPELDVKLKQIELKHLS